jgi:hypothetical protein
MLRNGEIFAASICPGLKPIWDYTFAVVFNREIIGKLIA